MLKWITCQNSAFLHFSQFTDPVLNAEGIMVKFRCTIKKGLSMFASWETRSVLYVRNTYPTVTIFRKTKTPPTNINLSTRHMTSLNQGLSSIAPFGWGRWKTLELRLCLALTLLAQQSDFHLTQHMKEGINVSMKRWKSHCSFTSCLIATINLYYSSTGTFNATPSFIVEVVENTGAYQQDMAKMVWEFW